MKRTYIVNKTFHTLRLSSSRHHLLRHPYSYEKEHLEHNQQELGMVSAETALGALALAIVFTLMLTLAGAIALHLHAQDMSRAAARSLTLGHSYEEVSAAVHTTDSRAELFLDTDGDSLIVTVKLTAPKPVQALGLAISATTVAPCEPGTSP